MSYTDNNVYKQACAQQILSEFRMVLCRR